ncbi:MAG: hypothetical protein OEY58_06325 [Gammaproteobacteria bacterium]|nr:hypothetical protein [Gammaproteobacteria bacterium]
MLVLLYTEFHFLAYVLIVMALFEGLSNLRVNILVTNVRKKLGQDMSSFDKPPRQDYRIGFDAERAQRLFIAVAFTTTFFLLPPEFWILNWFFAFGMLISGIVLFCPVIAFFRAVGLR